MNRIFYSVRMTEGPPVRPPNPFVRAIGTILSILTLAAAAFLGFFVFLAVLGVVLIGGAIFAVRVWLLKRHIEKAMTNGADRPPHEPDYIEAEFIDKS